MHPLRAIDDLETFVATRTSWHALAEHVLAKARWTATGRIGLRPQDNGFSTPHYGDDEMLWVDIDGLHHSQYASVRTTTLTSLADAAAFAGVELGAPTDVFTPTTEIGRDDALVVDRATAEALADWYGFAGSVLTTLRNEHRGDMPSLLQLWPEHFDAAIDFGDEVQRTRANYGASPGDAAIPLPYIYVGPWDLTTIADDPFWNQSWGTALTYEALRAAPNPHQAAASFFAHAHLRLTTP